MAGVLGIYGLIVAVILQGSIDKPGLTEVVSDTDCASTLPAVEGNSPSRVCHFGEVFIAKRARNTRLLLC